MNEIDMYLETLTDNELQELLEALEEYVENIVYH